MHGSGCGCDEFRFRRVLSRRRLLQASAGAAALVALPGRQGLGQEASPQASPATGVRTAIQSGEVAIATSYVSPLVELYGDVEIGERSFIAGNTILYAAEGQVVSLGDENNVQDNVYLLAGLTPLVFSDMVSIAHQAVIENSTVGDFTFFGFRSRTRNSEIGEGSMIMHNTVVEDVIVPPNRITPMGARITTQAEADALPELVEANDEFKHEVQEVNLEFAESYIRLYEALGRSGVERVGVNPSTSWNPEPITPQIEDGTVLAELVRIVGDVRLGEESSVGQRTAIRADEGTPIVIGRRARIQSRVTFHALKGTRVDVGENARIGDGNVIHGPVSIGDNFESEDDCVIFRATVEDNVTVRSGATVAGEFTLREGSIVPEGTVVLKVENVGAQPHFVVAFTGPDDLTEEQVEVVLDEEAEAEMTGTPPVYSDLNPDEDLGEAFFTGTQSTGTTIWVPVDLEPGTLGLACFFPDIADGMPHANHGMYTIVEVAE